MSSRRNKGGGGGHGDSGEERWLLPYADMITLLLGLFIVLFAMSTINAKQFDQVRRSLAQTFSGGQALSESGGVLPGSNGVLDPTSPSQGQVDSSISLDVAAKQSSEQFDEESQKIEQMARQLGLGKDVEVVRSEIGIEVKLAGDALFASGSYELRQPGILTKLTKIEQELQAFNHPIRIVGHTDGVPYAGEFGNWGLSSDRANAVAAFFRKLGYPPHLIDVAAAADTDPEVKPKYPKAPEARNRRIEILILEPGADDLLPNVPAAGVQADRPADAAAIARGQVEAQLTSEFEDALISELAATGKAGR